MVNAYHEYVVILHAIHSASKLITHKLIPYRFFVLLMLCLLTVLSDILQFLDESCCRNGNAHDCRSKRWALVSLTTCYPVCCTDEFNPLSGHKICTHLLFCFLESLSIYICRTISRGFFITILSLARPLCYLHIKSIVLV